jgi:glycosyltransferase involved in cell wall biosynthesis
LNEAENLPRCLTQIEHFAETIVLDTGSTDKSLEVARQLGAQVEKTSWKGFSATRREHFQLATQPWILWLDADEELTTEFIHELRELWPDIDRYKAYQINRLMNFQGKWIHHGDWFPDRVTRLFHRDSWTMPERDIHESIEIEGEVGRLLEVVPHYSYKDWADRNARVERYTTLWAQQQKTKGKTTSLPSSFIRAAWKLIRGLLLKGGIMDGLLGFQIAWSNALEVFQKYEKLRKLNT